ncbi:MAG: hypothetical protein ACRBF0_04105 [Calditrichia bacterium]
MRFHIKFVLCVAILMMVGLWSSCSNQNDITSVEDLSSADLKMETQNKMERANNDDRLMIPEIGYQSSCSNWQFSTVPESQWIHTETPPEIHGDPGTSGVKCWHYAMITAYKKRHYNCGHFLNANPETGLGEDFEMMTLYFDASEPYESRAELEVAISDLAPGNIIGIGPGSGEHVAVYESATLITQRNAGSNPNTMTMSAFLDAYAPTSGPGSQGPFFTHTVKPLNFYNVPQIVKIETGTSPKIEWGGISIADSYKIFKKIGSGGTYIEIADFSGTYTGFTDQTEILDTGSGVPTETAYYYYKGNDVEGKFIPNSVEVSFVVESSTNSPPGAPYISYSTSNNRPKISWGYVSYATSYKIYRKLGTGNFQHITTTTSLNYIDYLMSTLPAGLKKVTSYKVKAVNNNGSSSFSNNRTATLYMPEI